VVVFQETDVAAVTPVVSLVAGTQLYPVHPNSHSVCVSSSRASILWRSIMFCTAPMGCILGCKWVVR